MEGLSINQSVYDAAIASRNAMYDTLLEQTLNASFFRTRRDKFGNVTLQSAATPQNAIWKATEAMQMIQAVTLAKLKPITDDTVDAQRGFQAFIHQATGNVQVTQ
jgi:hypothetical protein